MRTRSMQLLRFFLQCTLRLRIGIGAEDHCLDRRPKTWNTRKRVIHGRRFVSAVHHAVLTLGIAGGATITLPLSFFHQFCEGVDISLVQEIARLLPTKHVECWISPWSAFERTLAHQKFQEQRGLIEPPTITTITTIRKHHLEKFVGLLTLEKTLLVRSFVICITRTDHHSFNAEIHHLIEKLSNRIRVCTIEESRVCGDAESAIDGQSNSFDCFLESSIAANSKIVVFLDAVHMHAECQIFARLEPTCFEFFLQEKRVRAEIDVLLSLDQFLDDLGNLRMQERLAAGNRNHRSATLIHGLHALCNGEVSLENMGRELNLPASRACQIAAQKRFKHQNERIFSTTTKLLS